jgi:outer membrane protein assembly factor BamB
MPFSRSCTTLALGLALTLVATTRAGDWPCWRGPTGQGVTDEKDLPLTWGGKDNENVLWKVPLPGVEEKATFSNNQSSPIVWKDRVFVAMIFWPTDTKDLKKEAPKHRVACYQTGDGKKLWETDIPPGPWLLNDLRGGYCCSTPATDGERVYALFGSSVLVTLDFDGKIAWRKEVTPYAWEVAVATSPVLYKEQVFVLCDGVKPAISRLISFDKKTGDVKWEQKRPTANFNHSTPLLADVNGKTQLIVNSSGAVEGLDPADGKPIWWAAGKGDVPSPAYGAGIVFSVDGRGSAGVAVDPVGEGDVGKTNKKWQTGPMPQGFASPTIVGDYVYWVHDPGTLRCWNAATGKAAYDPVRLPQGFSNSVSPVVTPEGRLFFASSRKSLVILAGPKYELLATNELDEDASGASPAVAGGKLFIKGSRHLYCIGKK